MSEDDGTRRWQRISQPADPLQALRAALREIRVRPNDDEARRRLRAIATEHALLDELALLLKEEASSAARPDVAAAFFEELADVYENLDQPLEMIAAVEAVVAHAPDNPDHHDRLAWLYRRAEAWIKAAESFERVGALSTDERGRAALRAAGKLYRDHGKVERAAKVYRAIVERRPGDAEAWRALDEILTGLGRWREVAEVRGERAGRADSGVDKAALLRSQARALEQAGDQAGASRVVAQASQHAPENVSGLVDYAEVLARGGQGREAAAILVTRIDEAIERDAPTEDVAALRMRLFEILEDSCQDRAGAAMVLADLLAAAPEYLPALERITATAARDPDRKVHAHALLRYAAALPDHVDSSAAVIEAARRFREAGDHRAAIQTFEDVLEVAPDRDDVRRELEETRTALVVQRAADESQAGNTASAERRLRGILTSQRHNLDANLALAEILVATRRLDEAADHLRTTLGSAPDDTPPTRLAPLVHRYATVMAALGEDDESHQLLHEAHRLDRRAIDIQLALGESCFARRLWRQASLHLGALADHPDAGRHARGVALGLVHAAQAEVRALRPANAPRHHEAAVRIDPACGPAWHALAEAAMERGDVARAAECLEREATATTEPRDRLRLYDALGDMALDVLGDPARAERCWSQVSGDAGVLEKLLAIQRKRGAGGERGVTCEALAELLTSSPEHERRRKELLEEAAQAHASGGDLTQARAVAERLIARHARDVDAVACASAIAIAAGDHKRAAGWLRPALAAWDKAGDAGNGDPRRADLWRRLGDADRALGAEQAALLAYRRAVIAAPDSDGAHAARRGIVDLAAASGQSANTSRVALVEAEQDPEDVLAWARELATSDASEDARAAFDLARALGAPLDERDVQFLDAHPPRWMASDEAYATPLDDATRRALIDDDRDGALGDLLDLLGEVMPLVCADARRALVDADLLDAVRIPAASGGAAVAIYPQIAKALGGPQTLLYTVARPAVPDLAVILAAPPIIVLGPRLASARAKSHSDPASDLAGDTALRFQLGRMVELARPRRLFAAGTDEDSFASLVAGLRHAFGPAPGERSAARVDREIASEGERLRGSLPLQLRRRITERLAAASSSELDPVAYIAACQRAADRAGLVACGDVAIALELAGGPEAARHLVQLASTQRYLAARRSMRARHVEDSTQPFKR